ncbi:MAG: hypothetical protein Ct9H300mP8_08710 [Gammaproteobacteria bacterium]|nr:MAG: hypothetical protein Ct9H300mP8_08710 [Gammaproteobacteria bacterium]
MQSRSFHDSPFFGTVRIKASLKLHLSGRSSHGTPVAYQDLDRPCSACNAHCGGDGIPASHATVTGLFVGVFAAEILAVIVTIWIVTVLFGGRLCARGQRAGETEAYLAQGHDIATRVENRLPSAHSYVGGFTVT